MPTLAKSRASAVARKLQARPSKGEALRRRWVFAVSTNEKSQGAFGSAGAEPTRQECAEQFRELMAHLQQVFWIKNAADAAVTYVSPAYATISGRTCQSLYDDFRTFLDAVHPQDRERVARAMAGQRETSGYDEEYRVVRPSGEVRWIWTRGYAIRDGQGQISCFAGIGDDITERKLLELDRARLAAIVEYSEDAIVRMSVDCIIIGWNQGAERQYGYTAEEIIGYPLSILFPPEHYDEYLRILKDVRRGEPVACHDTIRRRKDGTLINASVNIFPIHVRGHELAGASTISHDLTAIKNLEDQFIAAQKMEVVGHLAAGTAHDFNNYLTVILGRSDLILDTLDANDPTRGQVETIRQAATCAAALAHQLLIFSRRETATPVVLDINTLVKDLDPMLRQLLGERIEMTVSLGAEAGCIKAGAGHLGQVLMNLVANARDAIPSGGGVVISTTAAAPDDAWMRVHPGATRGRYVLLTVGDTGIGLTDEVKAHLFEPFFTTKPKGKGTGLGLATCDTIIKQCGGHIDVCSELGRGTTFTVYFPRESNPPSSAQIGQLAR